MRACPSCGRQNPDDRDFCECGEYVRWDPTGFMPVVTPEAGEPPPAAPPAPPAAPPRASARQFVVHQAPEPAGREPMPDAGAAITLRLPDGDPVKGEALSLGLIPGERQRVLALIRNQSGIVDNYDLAIEGLPDDWYTFAPDTVYLLPFGSGDTYEQEIEIHLHPPRSPDAVARVWDLQVTAHSKAYAQLAATAPLYLGIHPYEDLEPKVKPEKRSRRRRARYDVTVENKANAPVRIGMDATDPETACAFRFKPAELEVGPGGTQTSRMTVRPRRTIWIGRPREHRIEVMTRTGEEIAAAAERQARQGGGRRRFRRGIPGVEGPRMLKPRLHVGPDGVRLQKPQFDGPDVQGRNLSLSRLKVPGLAGAPPAAPAGPLLPTQAVFRQKPWLPWWVAMVIPLLILLALLLFMLLPRNVVVPDVTQASSAFDAERILTEEKLKLAAQVKEEVTDKEKPGSIVSQTPAAGEKAEKDSEVTILVAVGSGKIQVPKVVGMTPAEAEKALRKEKLSLGQATPQPPDPKHEVESQIPAAKEVVKEGTPVDVFLAEPKKENENNGNGPEDPRPVDPPGGGDDVAVPAIDGADAKAYSQKVADEKLVPKPVNAFDEAKPGTVFATKPEPGTKVKEGSTVQVLVSAGFPQLLFDDEDDIRLINGANGEPLEPVSASPQATEKDPTWSFDGERAAFVSDGRVFLADVKDRDRPPFAITAEGKTYRDPAWAPTADANVLALARVNEDDSTDLCFGRIGQDGMQAQCIEEEGLDVGKAIHWAPNGRSLLVFGQRGEAEQGIVRYTSSTPFSADPADWGQGRFVTATDRPGKFVADAALSPDGKRLALVANFGLSRHQLFLTKAGDFQMSEAKRTSIQACKVAWRSDGKELVVVQADAGCREEFGSLLRVDAANPKEGFTLNARGDNPAFQPLTLPG